MKSFAQSLFSPVYRSLAKLWDWLTIPSEVITEVGMRRQAQFLAAVSLLMLVMLFLQTCVSFLTHRFELGITLALLWISVVFVYGFSRSKSPYWGSVLLVYGFTLFAFVLVNRRSADVNTTLYGMIPIAYLLAGVLLSVGWQIGLVTLVLAGSVVLGTMQTAPGVNMNMLGGNLIALGVVLILSSKLRDGIERRRLEQVRQINRELEATRDDLDKERTLLHSSEARTRALLTAVPDMIFELSRDGIFLDFVPAPTLGPILPPEHFLGRSVTEVMPPEIAETTLRAAQQALASSQVQTFEYQLPSGEIPRFFEARMIASRPDAVLAIVRDITKRKQAEEALRESESRFRSFVEETTDGIVFFDNQGRVLEWNSAWERLTGLGRQQALGMHVWDVQMQFTPDEEKKNLDPERIKLRFRQVFETGYLPTQTQPAREATVQHMDGSHRMVEQRLFLLKSVQGFTLGVVLHDITERKQAEGKIQQRINELAMVNAISQVAASQLELNSMIQLTGEKLRQLPNIHGLSIAIYDRQTQVIRFPYFRFYGDIFQPSPVPLGQGFVSWVINNREPLVINQDVEQRGIELGAVRVDATKQAYRSPKSWMGIPMQVGDQVTGVICVQNFEQEHAFSEDDVRLWTTIASNVGIAIQNAQLYTATQQELAERKKLIAELEAQERRIGAIHLHCLT
jgi:PAS domain S-box-containing protein